MVNKMDRKGMKERDAWINSEMTWSSCVSYSGEDHGHVEPCTIIFRHLATSVWVIILLVAKTQLLTEIESYFSRMTESSQVKCQ